MYRNIKLFHSRYPAVSVQSDKIKNATHSRSRVNRGVKERWENLSELGHLSQMCPCTFTDPPQGTEWGSRWGLVNSMRVWTVSCGLSAEDVCLCVCARHSFVFFPLLYEELHTSVGPKCTRASTWFALCDQATWDLDNITPFTSTVWHTHTHSWQSRGQGVTTVGESIILQTKCNSDWIH